MTDSRPIMTDAQFEEAAQYVDTSWWMTGESLIHVPQVMSIEGWNLYGSFGQLSLTHAQRTLMMWADIVGQVSNGGFVQYCENFARDLTLGVAAVDALEWPELCQRFRSAMAEQAGDADAPRLIEPVALEDDPEKWKRSRKRLVRHLARRGKRWWQLTNRSDIGFVEMRHEEWQLAVKYQLAVSSGDLRSGGERVFDFVAPPTQEAEAFDDWFYTPSAKASSITYLHAFMMKHREQLYRKA